MSTALSLAITSLKQGKVIAYPTEAVYGLGCDPANEQAVLSLLKLKQRPVEKGLILVAGDFELLEPFVDLSTLSFERIQQIKQSWPGPVSWILPKSNTCPPWISGRFNSVAVRVSTHPVINELSAQFASAIVSTSANPAGEPPATTVQQIYDMFDKQLAEVIDAPLGNEASPSQIFDAVSGKQIR